MSDLSIQAIFSATGVNTAGPSQRPFVQSAQQRNYAQAFDEAMQRQSQRPEPQRTVDRSAERTHASNAQRSHARQTRDAAPTPKSAESAKHPTPNTESSAQSNAAGKAASTTQSAEQNTQAAPIEEPAVQDEGTTTMTGDLFAALDLAISTEQAADTADKGTSAEQIVRPEQASSQTASNTTPSPAGVLPAAPQGDAQSHANTDAQLRTSAETATDLAAQPTQAQKSMPVVTPSPQGNTPTPDTEVEYVSDQLKGLPMATEAASDPREGPRHAAARTEHTPLSLSAALSATTGPANGLSPSTSTYSVGHAQVQTAVGSAGFAGDFAQRIVMLAGQRVQSAQIAVTPADLGPINISMEIRGQEASVVIHASHAATLSAIEDALPKLREMFQTQGLDLVSAQIGSQPGHSGGPGNHPGSFAQQGKDSTTQQPTTVDARSAVASSTATEASKSEAQAQGKMRLVDIRV